jgi:hypothetical protein
VIIKVEGAEVLVWNANRNYTDFGQRIAAVQVEKAIVFLDFDRDISGVLLNCPLDSEYIIALYDANVQQQAYSIAETAALEFLALYKDEILTALKEGSNV